MTPALPLLIAAIASVESGNNPNAIGANGETGPLQISAICLADINRIQDQVHFVEADTLDYIRASAMFVIYVSHYCTKERLGHEPTWMDYALCWNGGSRVRRNVSTLKYWDKVKAELRKMGVDVQ